MRLCRRVIQQAETVTFARMIDQEILIEVPKVVVGHPSSLGCA